MPQCLEQTPQQLSNHGLTEGRSQSSVLSRRRGVKPRACSRLSPISPSPPLTPSPLTTHLLSGLSKTNAPGCPAHARQWRPPSVLTGASGVERTRHSQQLRTSGACPAAARVRPSESSWGVGAGACSSRVGAGWTARGGEAGHSWGPPSPGLGTRWLDPSLRLLPHPGSSCHAWGCGQPPPHRPRPRPRARSGLEHTGTHTHTTTAPEPGSSNCLRQKGFISFNEMI